MFALNSQSNSKQFMTFEVPSSKKKEHKKNKSVGEREKFLFNQTQSVGESIDKHLQESELQSYYNSIESEDTGGRSSAMNTNASNNHFYTDKLKM